MGGASGADLVDPDHAGLQPQRNVTLAGRLAQTTGYQRGLAGRSRHAAADPLPHDIQSSRYGRPPVAYGNRPDHTPSRMRRAARGP